MSAEPTCRTCLRATGMGTCGEPLLAGLADRFVIAWAPAEHASSCPAYDARPARDTQRKPFVVIVSPAVPNPVRDLPHQPTFQAAPGRTGPAGAAAFPP